MVLPVSPTISSRLPHAAVPSPHTIRSLLPEDDSGPRFAWLLLASCFRSPSPPATQTESPFLPPSIPQVHWGLQLLATSPRQSRPRGRTAFPRRTKCAWKIKPSSPVFLIPE